MDEERYQRLDQAGRISMGAPYEQLSSQATAPVGGDAAVFAPARIPRS
jgi:hypothetical protein